MQRFFCLLFILSHSVLLAHEFVPKSVWTDADAYSSKSTVDKICDGNIATVACLLDDSRDGTDASVISPPNGSAPITATFVMDLGEQCEILVVRFQAPNKECTAGPANVTVFACDDAEGKVNRRVLKENATVPLMRKNMDSLVVLPDKVVTRYVGVRVNDSYRRNSPYLNIQIAEVSCLDELPKEKIPNANDVAFPKDRLQQDWMYQDHGLNLSDCFVSSENAEVEQKMMEKVLQELASCPTFQTTAKELRSELQQLLDESVPGKDPRWQALYFRACQQRREMRLAFLRDKTKSFIYVKHYVLGENTGLAGKLEATDRQLNDFSSDFRPGGQLCLATLNDDGSITHEVLLEKPNGAIIYPNLSFDARTVIFSMRENFIDDDFHLYTMDLATREMKQITSSPIVNGKKFAYCDSDPCFLPSGEILFASTRGTQISCCWPQANTDLYVCKPDGSDMTRLTFDQLDTDDPQVLDDGRIIYTRWEYNDRNAYFLHPLFTMNQDGTGQMEYYGNNCMYPPCLMQSRSIPGSTKVIAVACGHHVLRKGKLVLVDRSKGTQGDVGIEYVAGSSPDGRPGRVPSDLKPKGFYEWRFDFFGQNGPQYIFPFAFDEEHYLVSFTPEGYKTLMGPCMPPFGVYFMTADGQRELLAFDWWNSTGGIIPVMERKVPPVRLGNMNHRENFGTFYVQNVYLGPGLEGVAPGTIKKLRVCAIEYRPAQMGVGTNAGEVGGGLSQTSPSFNNGSWDVKHVLGEVDVEEDGSCYFYVPARTPIYFQLLDKNGHMVQTMRSWATLQGGEMFSCLGCHENKNDVLRTSQTKPTLAMGKAPQKIQPFVGKKHPFMERLEKENGLDSVANYLGVNEPCDVDPHAPVDGFSYTQEIQPILDRHCVRCHDEKDSFDLTGTVLSEEQYHPFKVSEGAHYMREFTQSYMTLTCNGDQRKNPWMTWIDPRGRSEMLPPYHTGAAKSKIFTFFEPSHYDVRVSDEEKRIFACWIDLAVPFCGSHAQANTWSEEQKKTFQYFLDKRTYSAQQELEVLRKK